MRVISRLAEDLLASQEGLCSMGYAYEFIIIIIIVIIIFNKDTNTLMSLEVV